MRQAQKFEAMYLDVSDREAKMAQLLSDAEERSQILEEENLDLRMRSEALEKKLSAAEEGSRKHTSDFGAHTESIEERDQVK